jgi:tetratricopeptide (TPR) repeat protein
VVKEITANTAKEAEKTLLDGGYTDLDLREEDIIAAAQAGFSDRPTLFGEEIKVTAEDRLKQYDKASTGFFSCILTGINQSKFLCLLIIGLAIYQGYQEHWASVAILAVGMLAWLAFLTCVSLPSIYYQKLIKASDWSRWEEVLSLVATLKAVGKFSIVKVPATELIRNRAKAFAGQGRIEEALAEFKQCEGRPDCPTWLYKLFVGSLYTTAKQYDKAIEYSLLSIAEKPTPTAWSDLANRYARYQRDTVKAREAMAEADKSPVPEVSKPFRIRCLGIVSYLAGDYGAARRHLETAIEMVDKAKNRPFRDGHLSIARGYLSCVLAKQGDLPAAKTCFAQAKPYLVATKENELLAECRNLIGES